MPLTSNCCEELDFLFLDISQFPDYPARKSVIYILSAAVATIFVTPFCFIVPSVLPGDLAGVLFQL